MLDDVIEQNTVIDLDTQTDTNSINTSTNKNEIKLTNISKGNYKAWMLEISDPSSVILGVSEYFGVKGQKLPYLMQNYPSAVAGINAGGFGDANGFGNGGIPMGLVISEGEILLSLIKAPIILSALMRITFLFSVTSARANSVS